MARGLELDLVEVWNRVTALGDALCDGLGLPRQGQAIVTWADPAGADLEALAAADIRASGRAGRLRVAFHLWNDESDVAAVLAALAADPATRSNTSVCLRFTEGDDPAARMKAIAKLLEAENVAYDLAMHRDAPPGLRIWCGATVDVGDIEALTPWLEWAWEQTA